MTKSEIKIDQHVTLKALARTKPLHPGVGVITLVGSSGFCRVRWSDCRHPAMSKICETGEHAMWLEQSAQWICA